MRKVIIVNSEGEILKSYKTALEASTDINIDPRMLHQILVGKHLQPCQRPFVNQKTGHELADNNLVVYDDVFSLYSEKILESYNSQLAVHSVLSGIDQKSVVDAVTDEKTKALRAQRRVAALRRKEKENS